MRNTALILSVMLLAGCGAAPQEEPPMLATAVIMNEIRPGTPLEELLHLLDEHLVRAMAGRMDGESVSEFRRAEALSDRLLEANLPFEWFAHEQYSLESRLRQIQSMADRVMALLDTGAPHDELLTDLRLLRSQVVRLREDVSRGGSRAPPPIGRLLQGDTTDAGMPGQQQTEGAAAPEAPSAPRGPRPLGNPIPGGG
jgi:hypothetical protein